MSSGIATLLSIPASTSAPGEASHSDLQALKDQANMSMPQIELPEEEPIEESALDRLSHYPYQVFVLSEYGRPIYVSCGQEDQLCAFFALIGVFVNRVRHNGDMLNSISSKDLHAHFLFRKPLILCIVSKRRDQLRSQLEVLFNQILSTISRKQLETIYEKRGDNYDLRRLLGGTNKYMDGSLSSWHYDLAQISSAIRVLPMEAADRNALSTTLVNSITSANVEGMLFAVVLAHRQIVCLSRLKKHLLDHKDLSLIINLVSNTSTIADAAIWTPICLPFFNDSGFLHAYISSLWENSPAHLVLLSVDRNTLKDLHLIKEDFCAKIQSSPKILNSFEAAVTSPQSFSPSNIGTGSEMLWHFLYRNISSRQICLSASRPPFIGQEERVLLTRSASRVYDILRSVDGIRQIFVRNKKEVLYVKAEDRYELQCVLSPFCSPTMASILGDRLLKALKTYEGRYFITHVPSF
ncbi:unnamed protein product, partial [Mesorhabditis belari]|uniref:Vacuolar fusion protein MON1 homolog n=1 Tax=Mesorhabditis belari TaxID=2138241 RepID=A0AAF3FKG8_9BILA